MVKLVQRMRRGAGLREQRAGLDLDRGAFFMVQEVFNREW